MMRIAASTSLAFKSGILVSAISRTWSLVMDPALTVCGVPEPFGTPAAFKINLATRLCWPIHEIAHQYPKRDLIECPPDMDGFDEALKETGTWSRCWC